MVTSLLNKVGSHQGSWSVYLAVCVALELDGYGGAEASGGAALNLLRKMCSPWGSSGMAKVREIMSPQSAEKEDAPCSSVQWRF